MKTVYIVGGDRLIERMFEARGWKITQDIIDADLVQFTGGADVTPEYYGERNFASYNNKKRDEQEKRIFLYAKELHKKQAGICRGSQFLTVMLGGKLYQHCEGHAIHGTHEMTDLETGSIVKTTSTHHQVARPNLEKAELIAVANLGQPKQYWDGEIKTVVDNLDVEVVWYERDQCLTFQGHPEYGHKECEEYYFELLSRKFGF